MLVAFDKIRKRLKGGSGKKEPKMVAYQKYFQGYNDAKIPRKNGGFKVVRIYTAPYLVHDMTDIHWRKQKLIYVGLTLIAAGLYLFAAFCRTESNEEGFVMVPGSLSAAAMIFMVTSVVFYIQCPRKMTNGRRLH
jgi:hypothetical protein